MADAPSKVNGQINSLVGTAETLVGNVIEAAYQAVGGSKEPSQFTTDGTKRHNDGEAEIKAAQAKAVVDGTVDKVEGKIDSVVGAVKGDQAQQVHGNIQNAAGHAAVEANT